MWVVSRERVRVAPAHCVFRVAVGRERIGDDVVATALKHPDAVDVIEPLAGHDHRRVRIHVAGEPVAGADGVEEIERLTVDVRDDQVGLVDGQQGDRLGAVLGRL